uniref:Uncharacterized protein n=1 Tax=Globisporangium ultimum (strain ATCC 200006 / CBS 805.95 / DAOM BR144) TaxID=431595 RepID=K3W978_GLOUD
MMTPTKTTVLALAVMAATADAHSKMSLPKPTWANGYGTNSPSGTIDGPSTLTVPAGMSFGTDPLSNTNAYLKAFKAQTKYKSLKDLAMSDAQKVESGATKECGFSDVNGTPQPLPDTVQWDRFDNSHMGPCEVWCDDVMVFQDDNCSVNIPEVPAVLKYDKAKCVGKKMLTSFWIALHVPTWQIYTNCAPIAGGSSSNSAGSSSTTPAATSKAPAATTKAPAAAATPAPSSDNEYDDEYAPSPATTTQAPTPASTKKCKAKTRRN